MAGELVLGQAEVQSDQTLYPGEGPCMCISMSHLPFLCLTESSPLITKGCSMGEPS